MNRLPSAQFLKSVLDYHPATGLLYWKQRPLSDFKTKLAYHSWRRVRAGREAFTSTMTVGYRQGTINGVRTTAHRVIWKMVHDVEPEEIDHINGVRTDNRLENLRAVTRKENRKNAALRSDNTTGRVGVSREKGKYFAQIVVEGKCIRLGTFVSFDEACAARAKAEVAYGFHKNHGRAA